MWEVFENHVLVYYKIIFFKRLRKSIFRLLEDFEIKLERQVNAVLVIFFARITHFLLRINDHDKLAGKEAQVTVRESKHFRYSKT